MKKILIMLPVLGLASCAAPDGADNAAAGSGEIKPAYRSSRFGMGVGYSEQAVEPVKNNGLLNKPATPAESNTKPPARVPDRAPAPVAAPPQRKPLFSFLMKKEPPKALVVEAPPTRKKTPQTVSVKETPPELPKNDDDGLRLPDMLTMPEKEEFQSTNPSAVKPGSGGAVIARPPTDPPARPKPKESP